MDIFGTTVTAITEIYRITIFIKGVVTDIQNRDADKQEIRDKLDHELLFLESFKCLFYDNVGKFNYDSRLPESLKRDVEILLFALKGTLAEYGMLAAKHGLLDLDQEDDALKPLSGRIQRIQLKVKDLKNKTIDWALFDKKKLTQTLAAYSGWTERLRQTMSLMLLTLAAFDKDSLARFATDKNARNLGIQSVAKRQLLAKTKTPTDFSALQGRIILEDTDNTSDTDVKLAIYMDEKRQLNERVVVEYRKYGNELIQATKFGSPLEKDLKASTRDLAWLLHNAFPAASETDTEENETSGFLTLPCMGYIDQRETHRFLFVYRLPSNLTSLVTFQPLTLHGLISGNIRNKPALGNRFFMAHALASTVLNIHSFGWVHKNIWSRGVIMLPSSAVSQGLKPYLTGWGVARAVTDGTELAADNEIEPNFYRHPKRQGKPEDNFDIEHDLYALGLVLLEIGVWETISVMFGTEIDQATACNQLPEAEGLRTAYIQKAYAKLSKEMGEAYMTAVIKCLTGFEVGTEEEDEDRRSSLILAYRENVVKVVAKGIGL
ncbi:uncharacterized protein BHQ10_004487 [Talaromyces amestolkiae]|uniref:Protein kinase domain-containing protein n=1 Tax=Talaromyces amestolkiae TaxID=1196081 RepID=A0A364KY51_TALAM|nr:uncharacterized protein BHQ10_004487 [Talaromyces amestolkiae]RAO68475.1 hypothetical protein BHQ10_004487 [Talaromyces amestolkiae]